MGVSGAKNGGANHLETGDSTSGSQYGGKIQVRDDSKLVLLRPHRPGENDNHLLRDEHNGTYEMQRGKVPLDHDELDRQLVPFAPVMLTDRPVHLGHPGRTGEAVASPKGSVVTQSGSAVELENSGVKPGAKSLPAGDLLSVRAALQITGDRSIEIRHSLGVSSTKR